jgi:hypothetical protein
MPRKLRSHSVREPCPSLLLLLSFLLVPFFLIPQTVSAQQFGDPDMREVGYSPWECSWTYPSGAEFWRGQTFSYSYDLRIVPSLFEPTNFVAQLYVNDEKYGDAFEFHTLPGTQIAAAFPTWKIKATGPRDMTVQVRLSASTWMTNHKFEFKSTVAHYRIVGFNWLSRLFHRCWSPSKLGHPYNPPSCPTFHGT